jgi:predicted transcriptional regulator of viral defense system
MNARNNQKHTRIGIEMVRKLFEEGKRIFTIADARKAGSCCGMDDNYVVEALHHLSNTGWLIRLKRGLYLISSSFPGMTPVHEFEIAMALVQPSAISHWSAFWVGEVKVAITDPERTLIDGLISPKHFGGWAEIYSAFESHISSLDLAKMVDYSLRLDAVIAKRLGWIMEKVGVEDTILQKLEAVSIKGYRVLDSTGPRKGHCNKRWMVQENFLGRMIK